MKVVSEVICPRCKGDKWQLGPRGAGSQNIQCVCGYRLNVCVLPDGKFWVEDITKPRGG